MLSDQIIEIGQQFGSKRTEQGLSIKKLAEMADTTRRTIYQIESGESNCNIRTYLRIASALNISMKIVIE